MRDQTNIFFNCFFIFASDSLPIFNGDSWKWLGVMGCCMLADWQTCLIRQLVILHILVNEEKNH
jgi:hypothetical protein